MIFIGVNILPYTEHCNIHGYIIHYTLNFIDNDVRSPDRPAMKLDRVGPKNRPSTSKLNQVVPKK